jgi:hypothetical protein
VFEPRYRQRPLCDLAGLAERNAPPDASSYLLLRYVLVTAIF